MRIWVTGATGFLGGALARSLVQDGYDVTGTGRDAQAGKRLEQSGVRFIQAELEDTDAIRAMMAQPYEIVVHCGAKSAAWGKDEDFVRANILGTTNVANACLVGQVRRLVHVSTPSVYFGARARIGVREVDPLPPRQASAYARTKLAAEQEISRAAQLGLETIVLRPRALYGPGDQTIFPRIIQANEQTGVPLIGGGQAQIDLTYIEDAVRALKLAIVAPAEALGGIYNISGGAPVRFADAAALLFTKLERPLRVKKLPFAVAYTAATVLETAARLRPSGGEPMLTRSLVGMLGSSQTLNIDSARSILGYAPLVGLEEGLDRFVEWWRAEQERKGVRV